MIARTWRLACFFTKEGAINPGVIVNFRSKNLKYNVNLVRDVWKKHKDYVALNIANQAIPITVAHLNQIISRVESRECQKVRHCVDLDNDAHLFHLENVRINTRRLLFPQLHQIIFINKRSQYFLRGKIILLYLTIYV